MTIKDRIFEKLTEMNMSQQEFSSKTGIPKTTISDWKKKGTNPTADKILIICDVLQVTPEWLLSGTEMEDSRSRLPLLYTVGADTKAGELLSVFNSMSSGAQNSLLSFAKALKTEYEKDTQ